MARHLPALEIYLTLVLFGRSDGVSEWTGGKREREGAPLLPCIRLVAPARIFFRCGFKLKFLGGSVETWRLNRAYASTSTSTRTSTKAIFVLFYFHFLVLLFIFKNIFLFGDCDNGRGTRPVAPKVLNGLSALHSSTI